MSRLFAANVLASVLAAFLASGCTHTVKVKAEEPITINLNIKIEHEIRIKVDKELDDLFKAEPGIF
jgi:hypothetical protein